MLLLPSGILLLTLSSSRSPCQASLACPKGATVLRPGSAQANSCCTRARARRLKEPDLEPLQLEYPVLEMPKLVPPDLGQPQAPEPRRPRERQAGPKSSLPFVTRELHQEHLLAVEKTMKAFKVGLRRATVVMPLGVGDGSIGSKVLAQEYESSRHATRGFRALVLMSEPMLSQWIDAYTGVAGKGLFVLRIEPGAEGVDRIAQALISTKGCAVVGSYADAKSYRMAMFRTKTTVIDLAIFETAHAALGADDVVKDVIFEWDRKIRLTRLHSLFISEKPLEGESVKGIEQATVKVPGVTSFRVVANEGGVGGPEVFSISPEQCRTRGITVPVRIVPLARRKGKGGTGASAADLAQLHASLGITAIHVVSSSDPEETAKLNAELKRLTKDKCRLVHPGDINGGQQDEQEGEVGAANLLQSATAVLVEGDNVEHPEVLQALSRVAVKKQGQQFAYLIVPAIGTGASAGWHALSEYDASVQEALAQAAETHGSLNQDLSFDELPKRLQQVIVVTEGAARLAGERPWIAAVVNIAIALPRYEWDVWYGRLKAYKEEHDTEDVPVTAMIHGEAVGEWMARQFLEWRWGGLDKHKQERLLVGGVSLEEEYSKNFAVGLMEFERHTDAQEGDTFVKDGEFTQNGFPLGSWALSTRAAWNRGKLGADQKVLLYSSGFLPVAHPAKAHSRTHTLRIEVELRTTREMALREREDTFRNLVLKYHPSRQRGKYSDDCTLFLAGLRAWYLEEEWPPTDKSR